MSIKRIKSLRNKNSQKDIFEFNHIASTLDLEKIQQLKDLYSYYHKKTWIYKKSQSKYKKINYFMNISSVLLASVGVITGGITLNPIILGVLTTAGILLKSYHEMKNYKGKLDMVKFGFTTYEKVLTNLRTAMRGCEFDYQKFISEMKLLDQEMIDLAHIGSKIENEYNKKYK